MKGKYRFIFAICAAACIIFAGFTGCTTGCKHNVESWHTERAANCTQSGLETGVCTECGEQVERTIPALGHNWAEEYTVDVPASYDGDGSQSRHCQNEGCTERTDVTAIPALTSDTPFMYTFRLFRTNGTSILASGISYSLRDKSGKNAGTGKFTSGMAYAPLYPRTYYLTLSGCPDGYVVEDRYVVTTDEVVDGNKIFYDIVLPAKVAEGKPQANYKYSVGTPIHNFALTGIQTAQNEGGELTIAGLLQGKKALMLNFWFINCPWCEVEFPGLEAAYQRYGDQIAVLALNVAPSDSATAIRAYADSHGLSFYMAQDVEDIDDYFSITSCPTSVFIDAEGVVTEVIKGAVGATESAAESEFLSLFSKYAGELASETQQISCQTLIYEKRYY